ncbi:MAG: zinc metalloprotease HtpX [bacterium]
MAFSFIEIEERKSRVIFLILALLILLYFLAAWMIGLVIKGWIILEEIRLGIDLKFSPFLTFKETPFAFGIAILVGIIHIRLSLKDIVNRLLKVLDARPLDEKDRYHKVLKNIVGEVCVACGGKRVGVRVIPTLAMNAFSLTNLEKEAVIGVTEGLVSRLSRPQLEAVIGHEMAHIALGDSVIATISSSIFGIYCAMLKGLGEVIKGGGRQTPIVSIFIYGIAYFAKLLSSLMIVLISREREYRADAIAVRLTRNPLSLAEALYVISNHYTGVKNSDGLSSIFFLNPERGKLDEKEDFFANLFSSHPPVDKRLKILLDMGRQDLSSLDNSIRKEKKPILKEDEGLKEVLKPKPCWFACCGGNWQGPFTILELSQLKWFTPETWVSQESQKERFYPAYKDKALNEIFKERTKEKSLSGYDCPKCKQSLVNIEYEGTTLFHCKFCKGMLVFETKLERVLSREERGFSERIVKLANLIQPSKPKPKIEIRPSIAELISFSRPKKKVEIKPPKGIDEFPPLSCPKCQEEMKRMLYSYAYPVEIDRCLNCNSIWFDETELEILQYLVESNV